MNRKYIYTLIGATIVSGFSGYFIYTRIKIARVNAKFSTIDEAEKVIGNIDDLQASVAILKSTTA